MMFHAQRCPMPHARAPPVAECNRTNRQNATHYKQIGVNNVNPTNVTKTTRH